MNRLHVMVALLAVSACGVSEGGIEESESGSNESLLSAWSHARLQSTDGTRINLDFQKERVDTHNTKPLIITRANELWVNVVDPSIGPNTRVRVVLNNYARWSSFPQTGLIKDLTYAEPGRATAKLESLVIREDGYGGSFNYTQKIAVVMNGVWEQNPYGGDFQLELNNAPQW